MYDYLIIGAGFAGSVIAERIASQLNKKVLIVDKRNHIGGNAYDELDEQGILFHKYGPHIFHTNSKKVYDYLSNFTEWCFYEHKVMALLNGNLYPIPINKITLNNLYNLKLNTEDEVKEFYKGVKVKRYPVMNSEDIIVNQVGKDLFDKFFRHYTKKQWNLEPKDLSPAICGRIPVRANDDCRYFTDKYQFMPKEGFTKMFERILAHRNIEIILNKDYKDIVEDVKFNKLIYSGLIDYFFDYTFGKLPYRSIRFEFEKIETEQYQKAAVINYVEPEFEFTRVTEYKYFYNYNLKNTIISREYYQEEGEPYYPVLNKENINVFKKYEKLAAGLKNVHFIGRLAEYKYYNMDQVVAEVLNTQL
jgi:UDP-galactopyranose mutase